MRNHPSYSLSSRLGAASRVARLAVLAALAMAAPLRGHAAVTLFLQLTNASGVLVGDSTDATYSGAKGLVPSSELLVWGHSDR